MNTLLFNRKEKTEGYKNQGKLFWWHLAYKVSFSFKKIIHVRLTNLWLKNLVFQRIHRRTHRNLHTVICGFVEKQGQNLQG